MDFLAQRRAAPLFLLVGLLANPVQAQVISDGSLPTGVTSPDSRNFTIEGGGRSGGNLFHSFSQFSVPTNGAAIFNNAADVQNIFSRVTGTTVSNIDGLIQTNGSANLFLLNPNGMLFGANARLEIGGSFLATTAHRIGFADGAEFSATKPTAALTISVPIGIQTATNPGKITVQGVGHGGADIKNNQLFSSPSQGLTVRSGKTLALLGGDIILSGAQLRSPSGSLELGSVGSDALVGLIADAAGWKFDYAGVQAFQDIQASKNTLLQTTAATAGAINLRGRNLTFSEKTYLLTEQFGDLPGRSLNLTAENISFNQSRLEATVFGKGALVPVVINATNQLNLANRSAIRQEGVGPASGGGIVINARGIDLTSNSSLSLGTSGQDGNAGPLTITANSLNLNQSGIVVGTFSSGRASEVTINANSMLLDNTASLVGVSRGGVRPAIFNLNVKNFVMRNRTGITLASNAGTKEAGRLNFNSESVLVENSSGITAQTGSDAPSSDVIINSKSVVFNNNSGMNTNTSSSGKGGRINITADALVVRGGVDGNSDIRAKASSTGDAGNINLAVDALLLENGQIQLQSEGIKQAKTDPSPGRAGSLNLVANSVTLGDRSLISASNGDGAGGALNLQARDQISMDQGSAIVTQAGRQPSSSQDGGTIQLQTRNLSILGGAYISSSTLGQGMGGSIAITADQVAIAGVGRPEYAEIPQKDIQKRIADLDKDLAAGKLTPALYQERKADTLLLLNGLIPKRDSLASGVFSESKAGTTGQSGNIVVQGRRVDLSQGARLSSSAQGSGDAGSLMIGAVQLKLDQGTIAASTQLGEGGNIAVKTDRLLLRQGSTIQTNAGGVGNGGNLQINAPLIIGLGNSDVIANASRGRGGNIGITTQGILGLKYRDRLTPDNDITASSEFGVNGTVQVNTIGVNPSSGLVELPVDTIDPSQKIATSCEAQSDSSFVATGRGGVPENPMQVTTSDRPWADLRSVARAMPKARITAAAMPIEATAIATNAQGQVALIGESLTAPNLGMATCAKPR
jgi:filamentous hemagglutinin family protein